MPRESISVPPMASGSLPVMGHAIAFLRDPLALLRRGYAEHGQAFSLRLGRQLTVVLVTRDECRAFFNETDRRLSIRTGYPMFLRMFGSDFYLFAERQQYLQQRNLVLPQFRSHQLDFFMTIMQTKTEQLIEDLGHDGEMDLVGTLGPLVMSIAAESFLGKDFSDHIRDFFPLFRAFSDGMDPVTPGWLPAPHLVRSRIARNRLRTAILAMVKRRRDHAAADQDFLQCLCDARYDDGQLVPDIVVANLILLLAWAGHETTTGHLAWAMADLLMHPHELDRVRAEQTSLLPQHPLTIKTLHKLTYLDHALRETERLHPVAYMMARQATTSFSVGRHLIPKGAMVFVSPALTHRLTADYPDPDAYYPDRWRDNPHQVHDLIGFGGGLHRCIGVHFAYFEMKLIMTMLLRNYEFQLLDQPTPVRGSHTKWPQSPCRVRYASVSRSGSPSGRAASA
jgi:sterol 14-demethylase